MPVTTVRSGSARAVVSKLTRELTQERSPTPVTTVRNGSARAVISKNTRELIQDSLKMSCSQRAGNTNSYTHPCKTNVQFNHTQKTGNLLIVICDNKLSSKMVM